MPRMPRLHVDHAFYHVLARGNNKQNIFLQESDYYFYLSLLDKYCSRHCITVHAYALLPNHIHLLVQLDTRPLSGLMHVLQQTYTQAHNKKHGRVGHVFQGRYKAVVVDDNEYLLALVRYIHMNPVEAGLCTDPLDYRWSSHRHYMEGLGAGTVETSFIKSVMAEYGDREIAGYDLLPQKPSRTNHTSNQTASLDRTAELQELLSVVSAITGVSPAAVIGGGRKRSIAKARKLFIYCAIHLAGQRLVDIATFLGRSNGLITIADNIVREELRLGEGEWGISIDVVEKNLKSKLLK